MRRGLWCVTLLLSLVAVLAAQEGPQRGKVKKVDADKGTVTIAVGGKDLELALDEKTLVFGADGDTLKERMRGIKEGTEVFFKSTKKGGKETLIGLKPAGKEQPGKGGRSG